MFLKKLKLINFRNYPELELEFEPGTTIFVGNNGQGKTNILEAIYYLSLLRSFRTSKLDLLKYLPAKQQGFAIEGLLTDQNQQSCHLRVTYQDQRKLFCDQVPIEKAIDFINSFICVAFVPEDIEIINGPSLNRRQFMDILLCQTDLSYLRHLQHYNVALKNRNAVLKMYPQQNLKLTQTYDKLLIEHAIPIFQKREQLIKLFNEQQEKISALFFKDGRKIQIKYHSSFRITEEKTNEEITQSFFKQLQSKLEKDLSNGFTSTGIHRDEFTIYLGDQAVSLFGSAGEQRIAALILKLASLQILYQDPIQHHSIILLLDDVFGELDDERRQDFFSALSHHQIFVATTTVPEELKKHAHQYYITQGKSIKLS